MFKVLFNLLNRMEGKEGGEGKVGKGCWCIHEWIGKFRITAVFSTKFSVLYLRYRTVYPVASFSCRTMYFMFKDDNRNILNACATHVLNISGCSKLEMNALQFNSYQFKTVTFWTWTLTISFFSILHPSSTCTHLKLALSTHLTQSNQINLTQPSKPSS